jgi:hypothetical protein
MRWLRHFALFVGFVAALFRPAAAGALVSAPDAGSHARVGAFELVTATLVGPASGVTCGLHEGIGAAYDENASGYRFAAGGAKRGPKTDPTAPHNATIRAEADALEAGGNTIVAGGGRAKERLIPTPGGHKAGRRPDILYETPDGTLRGRNVGRTRADGTPVTRETQAPDDLNGPGGVPTDFVPYDR